MGPLNWIPVAVGVMLVIALIAGIAPKPFMLKYLDRSRPDFEGRRLPSVGAAPFMIAGVMATEVSRILTGHGLPMAVPTIYQFDALLRQFRRRTYRFGMRSPVQRLKRAILDRVLPKQEIEKSIGPARVPAP